jgi:hypothetical protein
VRDRGHHRAGQYGIRHRADRARRYYGRDRTAGSVLRPRHEANAAARSPITPRALTHKQAAEYCGLSVAGFDTYRWRGLLPEPTLPGKRYDVVLIDRAMDKLSGVGEEAELMSPLEMWRQARGARES